MSCDIVVTLRGFNVARPGSGRPGPLRAQPPRQAARRGRPERIPRELGSGDTGRSILLNLDESIRSHGDDLTPLYARRLAATLQNFADTCEILDGGPKV